MGAAAMVEVVADFRFEAPVIEWRGPAPFVFAVMPEAIVGELRWAAHGASYGWGCIPVAAELGGVAFTTSLFPSAGGYLLPLKAAVRRTTGVAVGDRVAVRLTVRGRG